MRSPAISFAFLAVAACGSGGDGGAGSSSDSPAQAGAPGFCSGAAHPSALPGSSPQAPALAVAPGFALESIAAVPQARELVALPNGDLLVGTLGPSVYLVPNADVTNIEPGAPIVFTSIDDAPAHGLAFDRAACTVYVGTQHAVYAIAYSDGNRTASVGRPIAQLRAGDVVHTPTDTDTHTTTSIAVASGILFAGVGSSCNACTELDPTRATIQAMRLDGSGMSTRARRIRNPIALAENPVTDSLWAGDAGQDGLPLGHPLEFFDVVTAHPAPADYGWPDCEEDQRPVVTGADCSSTVAPVVELPAYSTIIGAVFYPAGAPTGPFTFPALYQGGAFLTAHGSWHTEPDGTYFTPPRVVFVAMNGDAPATGVSFAEDAKQWTEFVGGFQAAAGRSRVGRPTGIAVGPLGSMFVSDDQASLVYRIRPRSASTPVRAILEYGRFAADARRYER